MNYKIVPDTNSWNLCRRRVAGEKSKVTKPGDESWSPIAYCANIEQAARRMLEEVTKDDVTDMEAPSIRELICAIKIATDEVVAAVQAIEKK